MSLAFPSDLSRDVQGFTWGISGSSLTQQSPLNKSSQGIVLPGSYWWCTFSFGYFVEEDSAKLEAFLVQLETQAGRVALWNFARPIPRGVGGGSPLVKGAGTLGTNLPIDGAPLSTSAWLKRGDYIGVNGELKMVTADVDTDSSGEATIPFGPMLRTAPADNAVVTLTRPTATFGLTDDKQAWSVTAPRLTTHQTLSFIERFE